MSQRFPCEPFEAAMRLLGRRWAAAVVRAMLHGAGRFAEIRAELPGVTDGMLSARLRELCAAGLAVREVSDQPPVQVRYRLTPAGRDLRPVLAAIERYGERHRDLLDPG
ncbi:winged helix-turn-helix transcriptional regulator [Nocardioides sp. LHG3406-4]|uniref:winged helix-turn-helix transcriptional regulator n=1 Tax=Nocardioides sp. LHG3406-4 TaxID=2804575 RepID=UPI003CF35D3E